MMNTVKGLALLALLGAEVYADGVDDSVRRLEGYDCSTGCELEAFPVCAGGITFQNECVAYCQGLGGKYREGPCASQDGLAGVLRSAPDPFLSQEEGEPRFMVTEALMREFSDDGFVYVGTVVMGDEGMNPMDEPQVLESPIEGPRKKERPKRNFGTIRVTGAGDVYYSTTNMVEATSKPGKGDKLRKGQRARGGGRQPHSSDIDMETAAAKELLLAEEIRNDRDQVLDIERVVGGSDERFPVTDTTMAPFRSIVEMDYGGGEGGCTGSVIGVNNVLTAAHCVYSRSRGIFYPLRQVAPGRFREGTTTTEPYGVWSVSFINLPEEYLGSNSINYDMAGLVAFPQSGINEPVPVGELVRIGEVVEPLPLNFDYCVPDVMSTIVGYPGDKPDGEMNDSGICQIWQKEGCDTFRMRYDCDTAGGNSGSPILDRNGHVWGVHTHGGSATNSGVSLNGDHEVIINTWF